jgi:hypothetical protein
MSSALGGVWNRKAGYSSKGGSRASHPVREFNHSKQEECFPSIAIVLVSKKARRAAGNFVVKLSLVLRRLYQ